MPGFGIDLPGLEALSSAGRTGAGMMNVDQFLNQDFVRPATLHGALFYAAAFLLLALLLSRLIAQTFRRLIARDTHGLMDPTVMRFLGQFLQVSVFVFAGLFYTHLIPALHRLGTAWLASVSVASLVLGLAAQQALGNLMAGVSLLLYRPFRIGDTVQIMTPGGLETAVVENLSLGYTVLRTADDRDIVVPNGVMASQVMLNLTRKQQAEAHRR